MDPLPPPHTVYGRRTPGDAATAAEALRGAPQSRLDAWRQQQTELIYSRSGGDRTSELHTTFC
jgi:hypothetical protein